MKTLKSGRIEKGLDYLSPNLHFSSVGPALIAEPKVVANSVFLWAGPEFLNCAAVYVVAIFIELIIFR
jgi:hypothetical protein